MKPQEIKQAIRVITNTVFPLSDHALNLIVELAVLKEYKKDDLLVKRGAQSSKEYFLIDGICKSFVYDPEGEAITLSYFLSNSILSPNTSRIERGMSIINIQALSDVMVFEVDASKFEQLMIDHLDIRTFGNTTLQKELFAKIKKEMGFATLTAKERLMEFRENYALLENMISHSDIASYLGITNISLSRLRKELMK